MKFNWKKPCLLSLGIVIGLLSAQIPSAQAATVSCSFSRNLNLGARGTDVQELQIILNENPATQVAASGPGSPGSESGFYGVATKSALARYQQLHTQNILLPYGLAQGTGVFSTLTRRYLVSTDCANGAVTFNSSSPTMIPTPGTTVASNLQDEINNNSSDNTSFSVPVSTFPSTPAPALSSPSSGSLATLIAELHPDGSADDSGTIQAMIDLAWAQHLPSITLPAGTFRLDHSFRIYGSGLTFSGQGDQTVLVINNNYDGVTPLDTGVAFEIGAQFDPTHSREDYYTTETLSVPIYNPSQPVTGSTIVFSQAVPFHVGEELFLNDGRGATALVEKALGGSLPLTGEFFERAPAEFVTVASVSSDGKTVTLEQPVIGQGNDYTNVLPRGQSPSENYLSVFRLSEPADHITVENLAIKYTNMSADAAVASLYSSNTVLQNIHVLNVPNEPAGGSIGIVGTTNIQISGIITPNSINLNSTREATVSNNTVGGVSLEEASTDNTIESNTLGNGLGLALRTGDMDCARDSFLYNNVTAGPVNYGGIGLWEGTNDTVAYNNVHGGDASIWLGLATGAVIHDNTATSFGSGNSLNNPNIYNNSWQKVSINYIGQSLIGGVYTAWEALWQAVKSF